MDKVVKDIMDKIEKSSGVKITEVNFEHSMYDRDTLHISMKMVVPFPAKYIYINSLIKKGSKQRIYRCF